MGLSFVEKIDFRTKSLKKCTGCNLVHAIYSKIKTIFLRYPCEFSLFFSLSFLFSRSFCSRYLLRFIFFSGCPQKIIGKVGNGSFYQIHHFYHHFSTKPENVFFLFIFFICYTIMSPISETAYRADRSTLPVLSSYYHYLVIRIN